MKAFKEEQAFRQWCLLLISGSTLIITTIPFFSNNQGFQSENWDFLGFIPVFAIVILFRVIRLQTKIDVNGIDTRFTPLRIFKRYCNWNEISECSIREYLPITEYGGLGALKPTMYQEIRAFRSLPKTRKNFCQ